MASSSSSSQQQLVDRAQLPVATRTAAAFILIDDDDERDKQIAAALGGSSSARLSATVPPLPVVHASSSSLKKTAPYKKHNNNNIKSNTKSDDSSSTSVSSYPEAEAVPITVATKVEDPLVNPAVAIATTQAKPIPTRDAVDPTYSGGGRISDEEMERLQDQGYSSGLAESLYQTKEEFALRYWIVDNSGSMQTCDGHRVLGDNTSFSGGRKKNGDGAGGGGGRVKMIQCTRWEEIRQTVEYHIKLANLVKAPTRFRLLNRPRAGPQKFSIAEGGRGNPYEMQTALKIMRNVRPGGCTPLTRHILDIHREVSAMAPALRKAGRRVALVIATDGLPTNELGLSGNAQRSEFVKSLRKLEGLPLWMVIRLCTDEQNVVDFYNDLDSMLEIPIDVLDDFKGEAREVYAANPWVNYCLPLQRMREMGNHDPLLDLIDERPFTKSEVRDFCALLFGAENFDGVVEPHLDWKGFVKHLSAVMAEEQQQWNPLEKKYRPWINVRKLNRIHGRLGWFRR